MGTGCGWRLFSQTRCPGIVFLLGSSQSKARFLKGARVLLKLVLLLSFFGGRFGVLKGGGGVEGSWSFETVSSCDSGWNGTHNNPSAPTSQVSELKPSCPTSSLLHWLPHCGYRDSMVLAVWVPNWNCNPASLFNLLGCRQDGSEDKAIFHQAWGLEFNPLNPCGRREPTPTSCRLTCICLPCMYTHKQNENI